MLVTMTDRLPFRVFGNPKPQGSKTLGAHGGMRESAGPALAIWRQDVKSAAIDALYDADGGRLFTPSGPIEVTIVFSLPRPRAHFGTGRNDGVLKPSAPTFHTSRPDVDKLLRSTLDALTAAGVYADDAAVSYVAATKTYCDEGEQPGAYIAIVDLLHEKQHDVPRSVRRAAARDIETVELGDGGDAA